MEERQPKWKRKLPPVLWSLAGVALCILLVSAVQRNQKLRCSNMDIMIAGFKDEMFITEKDVQALIEEQIGKKVKGCSLDNLDLRKIESHLQKDSWISKAQLYIDNRQVLHVNVSERLPVARIFTVANNSFYIDSEAVALPLSIHEAADVPVFTNVPDRGKVMVKADSVFWKQLSSMGKYMLQDSFLLMQIGQVNIRPENEMELYPVIGTHIVLFGTPENYEAKFKKLSAFYKQVLAKAGLNKYSLIDVRYEKQVVARLRSGTADMPVHEPQINIESDMLAAAIPAVEKEPAPTQKKVEIIPAKKKQEEKTAAVKKQKPKDQLVKSAKEKPEKKTQKIVVASNNKPDKKTIQHLSRKPDKPGLVEVDIRRKTTAETKDGAKAIMPKKRVK